RQLGGAKQRKDGYRPCRTGISAGVRTGTEAFLVCHINRSAIHCHLGWKPTHRKMSQNLGGTRINYTDGVDAGLSYQEPSCVFVESQPHWEHTSKCLEAGDSDRDSRFHLVGPGADHNYRIVIRIGNKYTVAGS